ncbi:Domain of uncharacterised function (DUF1837) [Escherichia coli]|uniref:Domain of uncharacterized function (DUF1837) n=1 Tax=Escherichia coli TaxID=562 RepID=A0A2X1NK30_ECOLX|nr:Domain of uncharacterised function (DUF1837) [Escherichia coli]
MLKVPIVYIWYCMVMMILLYGFGEAKFYNSIEDARLSSIINSVGDALRTDKLRKENSIITKMLTTLTY